jgi:phage terminase large subunit
MSEFVMPKRPRGRPKSKPANKKIFKRPKGRPKKSESAKTNAVKTTVIFNWTRQAKEQIVINRGGRGSSKSVSVAQLLVEYFFTIPNIRILILRKTQPSLRISVIPLIYGLIDSYNLRSRIVEEKVDRNIWSPVKGLIHFGGLDDPEKVKSSDWNIIWCEEATEFTYEDFINLKMLLRSPVRNNIRNKIYMSLNPIDEYHFIKEKILSNSSEDVVDIHSTYLHNPFLSNDYRQTIESLQYQNQNFYRIFALGEWGRLEHLIYSNWESVPFLYDKGQEIYGLDFGFVNPTALVRVQVDDKDIGVEEKLYESGLTNQTLIQRLGQLIPLEKRGHSIIYADSEDLNRIQEIRESGFWIVPVTKGPNSVVSGINYLKSCRIHITQGSDNLIKEIRGYSNKVDKNGRVYEEPVKFADHLMDAMRYAVFSFHKEGRDSPESSFFKSV